VCTCVHGDLREEEGGRCGGVESARDVYAYVYVYVMYMYMYTKYVVF
jgi:hypothetical protein